MHFYRNVFTVIPSGKVKEVAAMLKAIHAQEDRASAGQKAAAVAEKLQGMKLPKAAALVREGIVETLSYMSFPRGTLAMLADEQPARAAQPGDPASDAGGGRLPGRPVGADAGRGAAAARGAGTRWGTRRYLDMRKLRELKEADQSIEAAA